MSILESAASLAGKSEKELRSEIKNLRREVASLSSSLSDLGHDLYDDARDEAADTFRYVRRRGKKAAKALRRQTEDAVEIAQNHPMTTIAAIAGIGLLLAAFAAWEWERD